MAPSGARRGFFRGILACLGFLALSSALAGETDGVRIGIIHVNDVYQVGPIDPREPRGGLARLAAFHAASKREHPDTVFTFGGDTLSPSVESSLFRGRQMIEAWNAVGVDMAVPGNHEFDYGPEAALERVSESRFPWLAANLRRLGDGKPLPNMPPAIVRELGGIRVGFAGLITPDTAILSRPGGDIRFDDPLPAAANAVAELKAQGATVFVALTHMSLEEDRRLAATGLFDLILGGHDHHVVQSLVGRTPILKAGSDARDALHVVLNVRRQDGALQGIDWNLVPMDKRWEEHPVLLALERRITRELDARLGETIGETTVPLDSRGDSVQRAETNIGNFIADAIRAHAAAQVALINGGGIRSDRIIGPGPLTRLDLKALLPFENPVAIVRIDGRTLKAALEHGLARVVRFGRSGAMPHVSGIRVVWDPALPDGRRITDLRIGGEPVRDAAVYALATSQYLAGGGDGYAMLKGLPVLRPAVGSRVETDIVTEAIAAAGKISPSIDDRMLRMK